MSNKTTTKPGYTTEKIYYGSRMIIEIRGDNYEIAERALTKLKGECLGVERIIELGGDYVIRAEYKCENPRAAA